MAARNVLKNLNLFVNGQGYAGQIEQYNPPKQTLKTEEFMAGGMFAPEEITMAMEKMETDFTVISYDAALLTQFGVVENAQSSLTVRGFLESFDGSTSAVVQNIRGKIKTIDRGTWEPGKKSPLKIEMSVTYFKETRDGVVITEIDVQNMIFIVGGVDMLASARAALGI